MSAPKFEQLLINYLTANLVFNKFQDTGPHSFFYKDDVDTIFVYISNGQFVLITDGDNVVSEFTSLPLQHLTRANYDSDQEFEAFLNEEFLQLILSKF
jgi:hypothetical protein